MIVENEGKENVMSVSLLRLKNGEVILGYIDNKKTVLDQFVKNPYLLIGRPAIKPRVVIGAMIIKHKKSLSDEATIEEIRENPYLQYFIGNRENRKYLKSKGIRFSGKPLGRPVKLSQKDVKQELS